MPNKKTKHLNINSININLCYSIAYNNIIYTSQQFKQIQATTSTVLEIYATVNSRKN